METKFLLLIASLIVLVCITYFLPAKYNIFQVRTNRKKFKNALIFDDRLNFRRLKKHYVDKVHKEKIFEDDLKMQTFLNTAASCIARTILREDKTYSQLVITLESSKEICEEFPELKPILSMIGKNVELREKLTVQLKRYFTELKQTKLKDNPEKAKDIAINHLNFFFNSLISEDVAATNIASYFESDLAYFEEKKSLDKKEKEKPEIIGMSTPQKFVRSQSSVTSN